MYMLIIQEIPLKDTALKKKSVHRVSLKFYVIETIQLCHCFYALQMYVATLHTHGLYINTGTWYKAESLQGL